MLKFRFNLKHLIAISILIPSVLLALYFGEVLKQSAKQSWYNQATWTAEKATDTCLAWFALQQTQLRGVASLFSGSENVTEDEFFDVLDLTEVPGSLPLNSIAYASRDMDRHAVPYIITHSSDLNELFSPETRLVENDQIRSAIETAHSFPNEVIMSPPFQAPGGQVLLGFLISVQSAKGEGILLGTVNVLEVLGDLTTLHIPDGLYLHSIQITGMEDGKEQQSPLYTATTLPVSPTQNFSIRVDSGKAHLEYRWGLSSKFLHGPATGLGRMVQITGSLFSLIFFFVLLFLLNENVRIKQKVAERTSELSAANEKTNQEIGEKIKAEKALKASRERLQALSDASFEAIILSERGVCFDTNNTAENMFGYSREELVGAGPSLIILPEYMKKIMTSIEQEDSSPYEVVVRRKDGSTFPALIQGRTIHHFGSKVRVTAITDITDRREAEISQKESEDKYRKLIETTQTGFLIVDYQGTVLESNEEYARILKYQRAEDVVGRSVLEWTAKHDLERNTAELRKCSNSGQCSNLVIDYLTRDNTIVPVEINASVVVQNDQNVIMGLVRDISPLKRLEEERLKAKKLESVGVLAGGIAHDFNNILVAILGNMSLAKQYLDQEDKVYSLINQAEKASYRAKDLTQQLLTFSKGGDPVTKAASLDQLIQDSADFILRGTKIACEYLFPPDLWLVNIDSGQISQVIQNMIINSLQANDDYGNIHISCTNIDHTNPALPDSLTERRYVQVIIQDDGAGIPESILPRIFDPYFTTKEEGSGLGLALTHSIINKHNGHISVTSQINHGSRFVFYLPAITDQEKQTQLDTSTVYMGSGTVLIMDDEEVVRDVAKEMLSHLGYTVLLAANGEEALDIFKASLTSEQPIDFTIMDLTIPGGMGGREAAERFLELDKDCKIIVSSGYSNDPIMSNFEEYGFCAAIAKPFDLVEISNTLLS